MKCPSCGQWNRATFPRCFRCGFPLEAGAGAGVAAPAQEQPAADREAEESPTVIRFDEYGNETVTRDGLDRLAMEMLSLQERKRRGEQRQQQLRARGAQRGFAPSGGVVMRSGGSRSRLFADPIAQRKRAEEVVSQQTVDYDGFTDAVTYGALAGSEPVFAGTPGGSASRRLPFAMPKAGRRRLFGRLRFLPWVALAMLLVAGALAANQYLITPWRERRAQAEGKPQPIISASILDDMAAHTVAIPAPEGSQIYIKELRKSFIVAGGYATFQVADHTWYDLVENLTQPTMDVALTPFIRTGSGEQRQMDTVRYTIDIPLSPITLLKPDVTYLSVSTPMYNIQFHVMQNSKVFINNEDYSSFVNTQNGYISYNAAIQPVGDNLFRIVVRSQYYRENSVDIVIHRAVQDIPLDLASTLDDESASPTMTIRATTRAGASVTVLSPHQDLDLSLLPSTGEFSFKAVFAKIGNNTVEIRADYPGRSPTTVKYDVYYLPPPDDYTKKAWALDSWGYPDLLANMSARISKTQIYTFTGPVKEVVSDKPQLVIMDTSDGKGTERLVMVENQTKTQWVPGQRYWIFADAYGMYGNIPRLIARYTYKPRN
ncbi:MAG TPA: hypothetical protein VLA21_01560 [Candidatus Limnocylindria bacterium]|nr:hypothetical protein [Candidatus Limnocylindria bacterium]